MGVPVLIMGESGSGKTYSLKNFGEHEALVFKVGGKNFPFQKQIDSINNASYDHIASALKEGKYKTYIIDDSQYLLTFEMFDRAKETGYGKFTDIAQRFYKMLKYIVTGTSPDTIVYLLHHTEQTDAGKIKAKTVGKMLDNLLTVEGLFDIVLLAQVTSDEHKFITQNDGYTTCKSPEEMFEREIKNDLKAVDARIREYWKLNQKGEKK